VVKLTQKDDLVADPTETFTNLCSYQIKLNSLKCVFGIATGQLLDFVVSKRGIEANPEKIAAITRIAKPACLRDVQNSSAESQHSVASFHGSARRPCFFTDC
jgi:hypothetical protein